MTAGRAGQAETVLLLGGSVVGNVEPFLHAGRSFPKHDAVEFRQSHVTLGEPKRYS